MTMNLENLFENFRISGYSNSNQKKRTFDIADLVDEIDDIGPSYLESHIYPSVQKFMRWLNKNYTYFTRKKFTKKTHRWINKLKSDFGTLRVEFPESNLLNYIEKPFLIPYHLQHIKHHLLDNSYYIENAIVVVKITVDPHKLFDFLVEKRIFSHSYKRTYLIKTNFTDNEIKYVDRPFPKKRRRN